MHITLDLIGDRFGSFIDHPGQGISQKKALIGGASGHQLIVLVLRCFFKGLIAHHHPTEVGNVFTLGHVAIDVQGIANAKWF